MGRGDRGSIPFNRQRDDGPKGYRTEDEPIDDRPLLLYPQFWESSVEERIYCAAVGGNPRGHDEGPLAYVRRLSEIVTGDPSSPLLKRMPRRGRSQREWERIQNDAKMRAAGDTL